MICCACLPKIPNANNVLALKRVNAIAPHAHKGKPDAKFFGDSISASLRSKYTPGRGKISLDAVYR